MPRSYCLIYTLCPASFFSLLSCLTIFILTYKNRMPSQNNYKLLQIYCSKHKTVYKKNHFSAWEGKVCSIELFSPLVSFPIHTGVKPMTMSDLVLKVIYSEKATKFEQLFLFKIFFQIFVAFSKNINFSFSTNYKYVL